MKKTLFNEDLANELIQKHNLSPSTFKVWKSRGFIPSKYADPTFEKGERLDEAWQKLLNDLFSLPELQNNGLTSTSRIKIQDCRRGKDAWNSVELIRIKKEMTNIRNTLRAFTTAKTAAVATKAVREIMKHPALHPYVIFKGDEKAIDRLRNPGAELDREEIDRLKISANRLYSLIGL